MRKSMHRKLSLIAVALTFAGCAGNADLGKQIATNQQMRDQAMNAIAGNADLAVLMQQKLLANDSLRTYSYGIADPVAMHVPLPRSTLLSRVGSPPSRIWKLIVWASTKKKN